MSHMVKPFDPYYVAKVLADIWGREHGYKCQIILTPKEPSETTQEPETEQGGVKRDGRAVPVDKP